MSKFDLMLAATYCTLPAITVLMVDKFSVDSIAGILAGVSLGLFVSMIFIYNVGKTLKK